MSIFRARIQGMLRREHQKEALPCADEVPLEDLLDCTPYSQQYVFESFMKGGSKHLRTLNNQVEKMLKAPDGSTTEKYKNKQRERTYDMLERYALAAEVDQELIDRAKLLFHRVRNCAARLHSPLTVAVVCLLMEDELRMQEQQVSVSPTLPPKPIPITYGHTCKTKWADFLQTQTSEKN
jgi:hypothetical protein